jgi:hypothetical protein
MKEFNQMLKVAEKAEASSGDVVAALSEKYGPQQVERFMQARDVISATGGGISANEVASDYMHRGNWNPVSKNNKGIKLTKHVNEHIETRVRGGHAYDVLNRGGSMNTAIDTVNKWHFNYRDVSNFEAGARKVIPFYMFFANNIALQAQVWSSPKYLSKLNRTYFNAKRNMGLGQPDEVNAPDYIKSGLGLPLNIDPEGTSSYLNMGLPSVQFASDMQDYANNPKRVLSNLSPAIGLPLQALDGESWFNGMPYDNGYMKDPGPLWGNIPGMAMLPGFETTGSGGVAGTPFAVDALNGLLPGGNTLNRSLQGPTSGDWRGLLSTMTGLGVSQVTPKTRSGVVKGQVAEQKAAAYKRALLEGM